MQEKSKKKIEREREYTNKIIKKEKNVYCKE
jgi:hypothetical protein